jgi:hypothetical protein
MKTLSRVRDAAILAIFSLALGFVVLVGALGLEALIGH